MLTEGWSFLSLKAFGLLRFRLPKGSRVLAFLKAKG